MKETIKRAFGREESYQFVWPDLTIEHQCRTGESVLSYKVQFDFEF